eukprot:4223090-Ditylum_brightwellii.AAC.1
MEEHRKAHNFLVPPPRVPPWKEPPTQEQMQPVPSPLQLVTTAHIPIDMRAPMVKQTILPACISETPNNNPVTSANTPDFANPSTAPTH